MSVAFIVTKPLQFMIASMVCEQEHSGDADFLIADLFAGAADLVDRLVGAGRRAYYFPTQGDAYIHAADYDLVYSNCDVGVRMFQALKRLKEVRVYEEGIGTYRNDLYPWWKDRIFSMLGVGARFGDSKVTSSIYVFDPAEYRLKLGATKATPVRIGDTLENYISENFDYLCGLFGVGDFAPSDEPASLYLTSWEIDETVAMTGKAYIKPHPHLKDFPHSRDAEILPAAAPAELLIMKLAKAHPQLTVFHHGSSAAHYLPGFNYTKV